MFPDFEFRFRLSSQDFSGMPFIAHLRFSEYKTKLDNRI